MYIVDMSSMFLLSDLRLPQKLEQIQYNLELKEKLLLLSKNNLIQSFVLYGGKSSCKKTFVKCYLNNFFKEEIISKPELLNLSNNHHFTYYYNKYYYEIYPSDYFQDNVIVLKEFINFIKNSLYHNILVVYNIHYFLTQDNIFILKELIEKYTNITLIATNNKPLNLLYNIRCRSLTNMELYKIGLYINHYGSLNLSFKQLRDICDKSNNNVENLYILLQEPLFYNHYNISSITDVLLLNDINMFPIIKNIIKNLIIKDIFTIEEIFKGIINNIYKKTKINYNTLINLAGDLEVNSVEQKYKHIFIEIFIMNIYKLL